MINFKTWFARLSTVSTTILAIAASVLVGLLIFTQLPERLGWVTPAVESSPEDHPHADDPHLGHDHGHEAHSDQESIELSAQARENLRLRVQAVTVGTFTKYIDVPATIADWPGKTHVTISSPLTGVISAIRVSRGELIDSGTPLFTMRLTHQDLVKTQEEFLTSLGRLDVEDREIRRLTSISSSGAVAGKVLIAREYERDKLMASIRAARQSMLLHGLNDAQISHIEETRELVREITIFAPQLHADRSLHHEALESSGAAYTRRGDRRLASMAQPPPSDHVHIDAEFLVTELTVHRGESVEAGQKLARLSDYSEVLIEGHAFQRDRDALRDAADSSRSLQAVVPGGDGETEVIDNLKIVYIGNEVDRESRVLPFFVALENAIERSEKIDGQRYVSWRYKPGLRLRIQIPVAEIDNAIVVPKNAVAEEGPERYVFVENDDHFDRVAVHVLSSDSTRVAIANDGAVWPGQFIATRGAHQLQMAMKNKAGGAIDPHAGHSH